MIVYNTVRGFDLDWEDQSIPSHGFQPPYTTTCIHIHTINLHVYWVQSEYVKQTINSPDQSRNADATVRLNQIIGSLETQDW